MEFLIVSGLSGGGKSRAADVLEDLDFYCVDNMPTALLTKFAELCLATRGRYEKVALVTDIRSQEPTSSAWCVLRLTLWAAACTARSVLPSCWPSKTRSSSVGKYERTSARDGSRRPLCFPGNAFSGLTENNRRSANLTCQVMRCV